MKNMINPFEELQIDCFLTCPRGLEKVTLKDISPHCIEPVISTGGVSFKSDLKVSTLLVIRVPFSRETDYNFEFHLIKIISLKI